MKSFVSLTSVAAPLPDADIDTDVIFPARFLLLLDRHGLGRHLFHERRARASESLAAIGQSYGVSAATISRLA